MAYHYTLKNFLRQASNQLLAEYFDSSKIELGIDLAVLKPRNIDPLAEAIDGLAADQQDLINRDFQKVAILGDKAGLLQIVQEARSNGLDLTAGLDAQKSCLNRVFWTYLHHPEIFEGAAQFAVPHTVGRYWKRGLPISGASLDDPERTITEIEQAVSTYFRREEGRGKACKVEHRKRGPVHQFHAFPEDFPAAPLAWSKVGLEPHPYRPAFEVIFVFHEDHECLDVYFEGGKGTVEQLWQIFAGAALGVDDLERPEKPSYNLSRLKSKHFTFSRPPGSPIVDVRIRRLGFAMLGVPSTRVSIETDVSRDPQAIHDMIGRTFAGEDGQPGRFSLSQAKVISATVRAQIDPRDGKRLRVRSFDISEKSCSLKYEDEDLLLRQMLIDSGIDQTGASDDAGSTGPRQVA